MKDFFSISYRKVDARYFPSILSDEAMTSEAMKERVGVRYEKPHISVGRNGIFERYWHWNDFVRARSELLDLQLEDNILPRYTEIVNQHFDRIVDHVNNLSGNATNKEISDIYSSVCE